MDMVILIVSAVAICIGFAEVGFPWIFAAVPLAYIFTLLSSMTWRELFQGHSRPIPDSPLASLIAKLLTVLSFCVLTAIPVVLIELIPGPTPNGLLAVAFVYGFWTGVLKPSARV